VQLRMHTLAVAYELGLSRRSIVLRSAGMAADSAAMAVGESVAVADSRRFSARG